MRLTTLKREHLPNIKDLVMERLVESGLDKKTTPGHCVETMQKFYDIRCGAVYADSVTDPKHILALTHMPDMFIPQITCRVLLVFSSKEHRGDLSMVKELFATIDNYAVMTGCAEISG